MNITNHIEQISEEFEKNFNWGVASLTNSVQGETTIRNLKEVKQFYSSQFRQHMIEILEGLREEDVDLEDNYSVEERKLLKALGGSSEFMRERRYGMNLRNHRLNSAIDKLKE